jgi:TonB family protein
MKVSGNTALMLLAGLTIAVTGISYSQTNFPAQNPPALAKAFFPTYPPIAKAALITGDIRVRVTIDGNGDVTRTEILSGHKLLNDASVAAARQWKFEPQLNTSEKRYVNITFRYTLMPRCSDKGNHTPVFHSPFTAEIRQEKPWIICDDCGPERERELNCKNP